MDDIGEHFPALLVEHILVADPALRHRLVSRRILVKLVEACLAE